MVEKMWYYSKVIGLMDNGVGKTDSDMVANTQLLYLYFILANLSLPTFNIPHFLNALSFCTSPLNQDAAKLPGLTPPYFLTGNWKPTEILAHHLRHAHPSHPRLILYNFLVLPVLSYYGALPGSHRVVPFSKGIYDTFAWPSIDFLKLSLEVSPSCKVLPVVLNQINFASS